MSKPRVQPTPLLKVSTQIAPTPLQALISETNFFRVKHPNALPQAIDHRIYDILEPHDHRKYDIFDSNAFLRSEEYRRSVNCDTISMKAMTALPPLIDVDQPECHSSTKLQWDIARFRASVQCVHACVRASLRVCIRLISMWN